jgi:tripartite ATP-independent transporter DctP family solute receptor
VHKGIVYFKNDLEERSGGQLQLKIFPDGQLGSEREVLELLQIGSIAMTKVSAAVMANFAPEYEVLGIPYLFRDKDHLFDVLEGDVGNELLDKGSQYWLRGLCFYDAGSRSFYTKNKPIRSPDDLKGLKIRVMNHQLSVDMVNVMGASATPMAFGELYTALQQGVVDGAENNPPSLVSSNHYEVCKYYTLDEHSSVPDVVVIGTKFWDKLEEEERSWLMEAAKASAEAQKTYWQKSVDDCMKKLEEAGVEVIIPDKALFASRTASMIEEMKEEPHLSSYITRIEKTRD